MSWYKHKLLIDRSVWRCGGDGKFAHGKLQTKLLDDDGMMCCLGQGCLQLGIDNTILINKNTPSQVLSQISYMIKVGYTIDYACTDFAVSAMDINDNTRYSRPGRELALFLLGKRHEVFIQFTGSYRD